MKVFKSCAKASYIYARGNVISFRVVYFPTTSKKLPWSVMLITLKNENTTGMLTQ